MNTNLRNSWDKQINQIQRLTNSSIALLLEFKHGKNTIVASTAHQGNTYAKGQTLNSKNPFISGFNKKNREAHFHLGIESNKTQSTYNSIYYAPIHTDNHHIWGTIIIAFEKKNKFNVSSIDDISVFAQSISNQLRLEGMRKMKRNHESEQEIDGLKDIFEFFMHASNIAVIEYDPHKNKIKTNSVFEDLTGYNFDDETVLIDWVLSRFHPDDAEHIFSSFANSAANENFDFECRLLNKQNEYIWINFMGKILRHKTDKNDVKITGVIKDITHAKKLLHDLTVERNKSLNANDAKSVFLANISHEIRTPMNAIIGFAELLSKHITHPPYNGYLNSIKSSGRVLLSLINDILDFEKIVAGKMILSHENTDLKILVSEIEQTFLLLSKEKNLEIIVENPDFFPKTVFIDAIKIRQILLNLINNAIKFTEKGQVTIAYSFQANKSQNNGSILFSITDTGIGIAREKQASIFEPFIQDKNPNEKKYQGTGLGLSIVQKLVSMMDGTISLNSELGKGSCFSFIIPNIESSMEQYAELAITSKTVSFNQESILIADQTQSNLDMLNALCSNLNFNCQTATSETEIFTLNNSQKPDMIILDMSIPQSDPLHIIQKIRSTPQSKSVPVLAVSASHSDEQLALATGFDGFLLKPIMETDLVQALSKFFQAKHLFTDHKRYSENTTASFTPEELNQVNKILNLEVIPIWEDLKEILSSENLNLFLVKLQHILTIIQWPELEKYVDTLHTAITSFDFETIQKMINHFKQYLDKVTND
jgi:signal transduction histidine kinase/DNA-binding response OmpR family regulator